MNLRVQCETIRELYKSEMAAEVLRSTGSLRISALGMSMIPTILPGDIVWVESGRREEIERGTIALFMRDGRFFAHRIIRKSEFQGQPYWISRGDAMDGDDPAWFESELLGRVKEIERRGRKLSARKGMSVYSRIVGKIACRSDSFRNRVLRMHSLLSAVFATTRSLTGTASSKVS